jgi:predicted transcriptional regulator
MQGALEILGFTSNEAKVVYFLTKQKETTQRDIERACDLRQPEVSIALKHLKRLGIITFTEQPDGRAARPIKVYQIVNHMVVIDRQAEIESDYKLKCAALDTVKKCINDNL